MTPRRQRTYRGYGTWPTAPTSRTALLSLSMPAAYAERTARRLSADLLNPGFSGSCHIEDAMADYLSTRNDWDFASPELGINIADALTKEEYCRRCRYMIETVAKAHPDKPIVCTDAFTSVFDIGRTEDYWFRTALSEVTAALALPNVHYVNGRTLMRDYVTLTADMAHPDVDGQEEIPNHLVRLFRQILKKQTENKPGRRRPGPLAHRRTSCGKICVLPAEGRAFSAGGRRGAPALCRIQKQEETHHA